MTVTVSCFIALLLHVAVVQGSERFTSPHTGRPYPLPKAFEGAGNPPPGETEVYFSAGVDKLLSVDDQNYRFEVCGEAPRPSGAPR